MKNVACHIGKQRMLHHQATTAAPDSDPEGTQDGNKQDTHHQALSHCSLPQPSTLRIFRMGKNRALALDN